MCCGLELGFVDVKKGGNVGKLLGELRSVDDISVACFGVGVAGVGGAVEGWCGCVAGCLVVHVLLHKVHPMDAYVFISTYFLPRTSSHSPCHQPCLISTLPPLSHSTCHHRSSSSTASTVYNSIKRLKGICRCAVPHRELRENGSGEREE
ncbi:hypothetical protein L1987_53619 [Smallanthus sonchifolius]|uniref:Uncharacterized protein n=1 Tax=Smallanthus sonchifolius TaxID=185202 RepID=A0ACB9EX12_9ASTR|nr:hypothetical protein L1987_53619 [Smallanthus sonchifolius]